MIHYTPEGQVLRVGLNITVGQWRKPWISFRWVWYDTRTRTLTSLRLRIRFWLQPFFIWGKDEGKVIDSWLWENDFAVLPKSVLEDLAPQLLALSELYRLNGYPYSLDGLVLFRGDSKTK
jgi:hypothetical protein